MEDNPYVTMLDAFTPGEGAPALVLGLVTDLSPLRVLCEGNTLEGEDLLCNAALLAGAAAKVNASFTGSGTMGSGELSVSGAASLALSGTVTQMEPTFALGDRLLMVPMEERQRYAIVCKVVSL